MGHFSQHLFALAITSIIAALLSVGLAQNVYGQSADDHPRASNQATAGSLLVAPTRVIFSGRTRSAELIIKNQGNRPTTYRLSLVDIDIDADGNMTNVEHYEKTAKKLIRFSPRQVTIAPGRTQKVKLLLRRPADLMIGEYRTHLKFQALPDASIGEDVEATEVADGISVKLVPLVGLTIPVIAQHGQLAANLDMKASKSGKHINVTLNRSGKRSVFGDIYVKQEGQVIATVSASLILPRERRGVQLRLPENTNQQPLTVEFIEKGSKGKKPLASVTL